MAWRRGQQCTQPDMNTDKVYEKVAARWPKQVPAIVLVAHTAGAKARQKRTHTYLLIDISGAGTFRLSALIVLQVFLRRMGGWPATRNRKKDVYRQIHSRRLTPRG